MLHGRAGSPDGFSAFFTISFRLCGYGGIGRRAGFRFQWETVQVQVLLAAVYYGNGYYGNVNFRSACFLFNEKT